MTRVLFLDDTPPQEHGTTRGPPKPLFAPKGVTLPRDGDDDYNIMLLIQHNIVSINAAYIGTFLSTV